MKKAFFILSLLFAGFTGFASDLSGNTLKTEKSKNDSGKKIVKPLLEVCSTATMELPNGNTVSCTACAETTGGPQGSEVKAADCLMDILVQQS